MSYMDIEMHPDLRGGEGGVGNFMMWRISGAERKWGVASHGCNTSDYMDNMPPQQGWQCPVCGRVYAPWMSECTHCGNEVSTVTTTTFSLGSNTDHVSEEEK